MATKQTIWKRVDSGRLQIAGHTHFPLPLRYLHISKTWGYDAKGRVFYYKGITFTRKGSSRASK